MIDNSLLISRQEDKELFTKQTYLVESFYKGERDALLRIALLQTLSPICDSSSAIKIMKLNMIEDYIFLIIGAYMSAENYNHCDNVFLSKLLSTFQNLNNFQKSIVEYLCALQQYNKCCANTSEILTHLDNSISLCDCYAANYYTRYLILHDLNDFNNAKNNVYSIVKDTDNDKITIDDLIEPMNYIEEHILMRTMVASTFESIFNQNTNTGDGSMSSKNQ